MGTEYHYWEMETSLNKEYLDNCELNFSTVNPLSFSSKTESIINISLTKPNCIYNNLNRDESFELMNLDFKDIQNSSEITNLSNKENNDSSFFKSGKNIESIKRLKIMDDSANLTDLGESSILNLLNQFQVKDRNLKKKHPILDRTINPLIEEEEEVMMIVMSFEIENSNILKSLTISFKEGDVLKTKNSIKMINDKHFFQTSQSFVLNPDDMINSSTIEGDDLIKKLENSVINFEIYEDFNSQMVKNVEKTKKIDIGEEVQDLILIYNHLETLNPVLSLVSKSTFDENEKLKITSICDNFSKKVLIKYLSLKPFTRLITLQHYNERVKEIQQLNSCYRVKKIYKLLSDDNNCIDWLPMNTNLPFSLIKNLNFNISCYPKDDDQSLNETLCHFIERKYENNEYLIIITNSLILKFLDIFKTIVTIYKKNSNPEKQKESIDLFLCTCTEIIFKFLTIGEILRSNEFLVRLYSVFDDLLMCSFNLNSLTLFSHLIKEKSKQYQQKLNNISISCRSISPLDKVDKNYWGKYLISKNCVQEFDKKCNEAINCKNLSILEKHCNNYSFDFIGDISLESSDYINLIENLIDSEEPNYTLWLENYMKAKNGLEKNKQYQSDNNLLNRFFRKLHLHKKPKTDTLDNENKPPPAQGNMLTINKISEKDTQKYSNINNDNVILMKKRSLFEIFNINPKSNKTSKLNFAFEFRNENEKQKLFPYRSLMIMTRNLQQRMIEDNNDRAKNQNKKQLKTLVDSIKLTKDKHHKCL
ncbi:hypothetical protein ACO0SA_003580 [Hanseniaspora valbyensis]